VKDDDRGMVVTFQGETLFKTGKSDLLPAAMVKLDQVADTLRGQERKILVVGHTDNQGGNGAYNQTLSEKRANAVRDYLVAKGIPSDLIRAEGRGPTQPVADNTSVEGRAANRRVEIIVQPKGQ
jgi:outer membrane protein OmpA-like peptidoglycan-associated protein